MQNDEIERSDNVDREVVIWNYEGREVPTEIIWPTGAVEDRLLDVLADFLWRHRHLRKG